MSLTAAQLEIRKTGITATDATGISGVNRFTDPVAVYLSKVDPDKLADRKAENPDQKELGHALEPAILDMLGRRKNLVLAPCANEDGTPKTIRSAKYDWALATPDRLVVAVDGKVPAPPGQVPIALVGVAEAKNVGLRMIGDWRQGDTSDNYDDGEEFVVPDYVHVQVAWQMIVTGTRIGYVAALLGGRDFRTFEIHYDDTLSDTLISVCGDFWTQHVLKRVPPSPAATERAAKAIEAMYPRASTAILEAPGIAEQWANQWIDAKTQEKYFEQLRLQAENQLKMLTGANGGMASKDWKLSWKNTASAGVDYKGLCSALAPAGVPDDLIKQYTRPGYRRFLMTPSKARQAAALAKAATGSDDVAGEQPAEEV